MFRSSFVFSAALHAALFIAWAFVLVGQAHRPAEPRPLLWVEVDPVPAPKKNRRVEKNRPEQRIVQSELAESSDEPVPPQAFLGARNQRVVRQTVSASAKSAASSSEKARAMGQAPVRGVLAQLGLAILPSPKRQAPGDAHQWVEEGVAPQDYIPGLEQSERTALNTKEYAFFGYFQRIRERLDLAWEPVLRDHLLKFYRQGRRLASEMDHTTRVVVTLDDLGQVLQVELMEESGTRALDDAAIRAFNSAGPFPNPPRGMMDHEGRVQVRWDFILKT